MSDLIKNLGFYVGVVLLMVACAPTDTDNCDSSNLSDRAATHETVELYSKLSLLRNEGIMLGHQNPFVCTSTESTQQSDVEILCGDYPAVFGWELAGIDAGAEMNTDSISVQAIMDGVRRAYQMGGIITFTWCPTNFLLKDTLDSIASNNLVELIESSEQYRQQYLLLLDNLADFISGLIDEQGEAIPVIMQPFAEDMPFTSYWWETETCTPDDFKRLWILTIDYLRNVKQLHQILFVYAPAADKMDLLESYYPGNSYTDIIALDVRMFVSHPQNIQEFMYSMNKHLNQVVSFADSKAKIPAIMRTGIEGIKVSDYFTQYLYPVLSKHKLSYVLFEKNSWNRKGAFFVPIPGHPASDDFVAFAGYSDILTCSDVND